MYIAHHRWLDTEFGPKSLYKVGHTGNLASRLGDSAYVTCFPPGWRYVATFELPTKEDAFLLETAVLHCCRHRRVDTRELVRMPAEAIAEIAREAARALGLAPTLRDAPSYLVTARTADKGASTSAAPAAAPAEPSAWAASRPLVERLTVPRADPMEELTIELGRLTLGGDCAVSHVEDYVNEVLTWDFSDVKPPTAVVPVPAAVPAAVAAPAAKPAAKPKAAVTASASSQDMILDEIDDSMFASAVDMVVSGFAPRDTPALVNARSPFDLRAVPIPLVARDYQRDAIELCSAELKASGVAILQMACRCGKTPVAHGVVREHISRISDLDRPVCALYLVPGLSLLRQTAQKMASYGFTEPMLLVGSDQRPVPMPGGRDLTMTTDPAVIRAFVAERGRRLVISTYQSSAQVPTDAFEITVFDECHRVCGGKAPRPFNHFILSPRVGARLFMTATPAYDPPSKSAITMKDRALFGGVAYRYHLRQGIAAGFVNDFRLEIVAAPTAARTARAEEEAMPGQLLAAMAKVDKLLVFCRDINHATRLCTTLKEASRPAGVFPFECLVAHSRMGSGGAAEALRKFAEVGTRTVLFNCRLFQEGVEIPSLNAVFFASPRHSPRDIIQSVCRPLNRVAGKPVSIIFLPILHDPARSPEDPENLRRYASIVPFVDALLDEDPRLYEHLLDPAATPYPIDILGAHSLTHVGPKTRAALLCAVRRAVRYGTSASSRPAERLLRVENVPWDRAYAEIRRVVETCNRYPKTTDAWHVGEARVCLHRFYRWAADEYREFRAGRPSKLEPHQIHDLQQLPQWDLYGVEGPYPWKLCMEFLEQWLREHNGEPPMVEVNKGGYIGLEATAIERLSGALTCVNQADGKARKGKAPGSGYTLSAEKQADLERVCAPYKLRWKKERDETGALIEGGEPTFIQEAYARFKAYYKAHGPDGDYIQRWFPYYPGKHFHQENLEVQKAGVAPPRWRVGRRKKNDDGDGDGEPE